MNTPMSVLLCERGLPRLLPRVPAPCRPWPDHVLVIDTAREHGRGGQATVGRYLFRAPNGSRVEGWFEGPAGIPPGWTPPPGSGAVLPLLERRPGGRGHGGFLEDRLLKLTYREYPRAAIAAWDAGAVVASLAAWTTPGGRDRGGLSHVLWTFLEGPLAGEENRDRPRIEARPLEGGGTRLSYAGRRKHDPQDYVPPPERHGEDRGGRTITQLCEAGWRHYEGRFADLLALTYTTTGEERLSLTAACRLFGIDLAARCEQATPTNLVLRVQAIEQLYDAVLAEFALLYPGAPYLAPDRGLTPASPGSAVRRAAGIPQPLRRADAGPRRALAAAMVCAGVGARSEVGIIRHPLPAAHVDAHALYALVSALTRSEQLLTHRIRIRHLTGKRSLARVGRLLQSCTADALLADPSLWPRLRFIVRVRGQGEAYTIRYRAREPDAPITATASVVDGEIWTTGYEAALARATDGQVPDIVEAYVWEEGDLLPDLKLVDVFGGWIYDATGTQRGAHVFEDFGLLVAAYRMHLKLEVDGTSDDLVRLRRRGAVKPNGNAFVYGKAVQFDLDAGAKPYAYTVDTTRGRVPVVARPERPGEWAYPPQAAFIVGAGKLMLGLLLDLVAQAGGCWSWADTDGAAIIVTTDGGLLPCPGGPHHDADGRQCVRALSWAELDKILRRFAPLARAVGLPIPAQRVIVHDHQVRVVTDDPDAAPSIFKIETLNLHAGDSTGIEAGLEVVSFGQKRYFLSRRDDNGDLAFDPRATYSGHGLGNYINLSGLGEQRYRYQCHRILDAWLRDTPIDEPDWLAAPLLTHTIVRRPEELERLQGAIPHLCAHDALLIAHRWAGGAEIITRQPTPDGWDWTLSDWVDATTGESVTIEPLVNLAALLGQPSLDPGPDRRPVVVRSVREQLRSIQRGNQRAMTTPTHQPCTPSTRGVIIAQPVRIVARENTGKESHRLAERQAGLNPDAGHRQVFAHDPNRLSNALAALEHLTQRQARELALPLRILAYARSGAPVTDEQLTRLAEAAATLARPTRPPGVPAEAPTDVLLATHTPSVTTRACRKPGCDQQVTGRRTWCKRHAQASSTLKKRWRAALAGPV